MNSARRLYRFGLAFALVGAVTVATALAATASAVDLSASPADLAMTCRRLLEPGGVAALAAIALLGLSIVVAYKGVRSVVRQLGAQRRFIAGLGPVERADVGGTDVRLVSSERPLAFCAGLARPAIYLSSGALASLSEDELCAVLEHERHHRARRDPLRLLAARSVGEALFFLPAMPRLAQRYAALAELAADEAAVAVAPRRSLASALLAFGELAPDAGVVGIAPERVDHLLGEPARWQLSLSVVAGSALVAVGIVALALTLALGALGGTVRLPVLLAETCMVAMTAAPVALAAGGLVLSRRVLPRRI